MLEAIKKQVRLKSYSLKIRIDSVNQILKNKEKVKQTRNISMLTRITDRKIPCIYIHVYVTAKNWRPGPYNSLRHADNRRYFSGLSLMNSNMIKPEKFDRLHLVCHFAIPLTTTSRNWLVLKALYK